MKRILLISLSILSVSTCEKACDQFNIIKPAYDETQFVKMTVSWEEEENQFEWYRKVGGLGPVDGVRIVKRTSQPDSVDYRFFLSCCAHNPESVYYEVKANELVLRLPIHKDWGIGEKYRMGAMGSNSRLFFSNAQESIYDFLVCSKWEEEDNRVLRVLEGSVELIDPSAGGGEYYAIRFSFSAVDKAEKQYTIYGTVQNKRESGKS